jgi:hypothetical protein
MYLQMKNTMGVISEQHIKALKIYPWLKIKQCMFDEITDLGDHFTVHLFEYQPVKITSEGRLHHPFAGYGTKNNADTFFYIC